MAAASVGGVRVHGDVVNGGVLAYRRTAEASLFFTDWIRRYRAVMHATRREQPVLQDTIQHFSRTFFRHLPRRFNCRGADYESACRSPAKSDDSDDSSCLLVHDHAAPASYAASNQPLPLLAPEAVAFALRRSYARACPKLSGGHRVVVFAGDDSHALDALATRLDRDIRKNNDVFPCRTRSPDEFLGDCTSSSGRRVPNRYALVALADRPPPPTFITPVVLVAWVSHPAARHGARLLECHTSNVRAEDCLLPSGRLADWLGDVERFALVLLADRPRDSAALLEAILPSHFLTLGSLASASEDDEQRRDTHLVQQGDARLGMGGDNTHLGQKGDTRLARLVQRLGDDDYVTTALAADLALYRSLVDLFDRRLSACLPSGDEASRRSRNASSVSPSSSRRGGEQEHLRRGRRRRPPRGGR
mmetsp:Transcript_15878/g.48015  ORF Transcript_15878/g.48015 Transcript_15878/m.48015 type:complete len:419 (+) Transcript_15878:3-1259(+)